MKYVIGIDGGGTKTILRAASLEGTALLEIAGGPSNLHSASAEQVSKVLHDMMDSALKVKVLKKEDCLYLCMGAAGVDRENEKMLLERLFQSYGLSCPLYIANDAEAMLASGVGKPEGVVVISGTGSIAYGRDKRGNTTRSGGWGHLIGDEGSGYWIAREAVNTAVKCFDGRGEKTALLEMLMAKLNIKEPWNFIEFFYNGVKGKNDVAALAVVVDDACKAGDRAAIDILTKAAKELFAACDAVIKELDFENNDLNVIAGGSVLKYNDFIFDNLRNLLLNKYPKASVQKPSQNAASGAVNIALYMLNGNK
jgi:N-acetylglucosamine kinase-like BadF-type ATPase